MLHRADVREILDRSGHGGTLSALHRLRYVRDAAYGISLCVQAVNRLHVASGARAIMDSEPIRPPHRGVNVAAHNAALSWNFAAEQFDRRALGLGE